MPCSGPLCSVIVPGPGQQPGQEILDSSPVAIPSDLGNVPGAHQVSASSRGRREALINPRFLCKAFITALLNEISEVRLSTASLDKPEERKN